MAAQGFVPYVSSILISQVCRSTALEKSSVWHHMVQVRHRLSSVRAASHSGYFENALLSGQEAADPEGFYSRCGQRLRRLHEELAPALSTLEHFYSLGRGESRS
jgi:hypothetical protein